MNIYRCPDCGALYALEPEGAVIWGGQSRAADPANRPCACPSREQFELFAQLVDGVWRAV